MWTPFPTGNTCEDVLYDPSPLDAAAMIRLCNFETGKEIVLESHRTWLKPLVKMTLAAQNSWIDLVGYASELQYSDSDKTGGNWALSQRRCAAVQKEMQALIAAESPGRNIDFHVIMGKGDSVSDPDPTADHNHGFFRAVVVKFFAPPQKWDPVKLRHGYTTVGARHFEFEAIENAGAGLSVYQRDALIFGIHDLDNHRWRYFGYTGNSGSVPIPKSPAISFSAEHHSVPVPFTTDVAVLEMDEFESDDAHTDADPGVTLGDNSYGGTITLEWTPKTYKDHNLSKQLKISFSFGRGFGVGLMNSGWGKIRILDPSFRPTIYSR